MSGFQSVTFEWDGVEYTIPPEKQMKLVHEVEAALSPAMDVDPVQVLLATNAPRSRLANAMAAAVRAGGGEATEESVYIRIAQSMRSGDATPRFEAQTALVVLFNILLPPSDMAQETPKDTPAKKPQAAS